MLSWTCVCFLKSAPECKKGRFYIALNAMIGTWFICVGHDGNICLRGSPKWTFRKRNILSDELAPQYTQLGKLYYTAKLISCMALQGKVSQIVYSLCNWSL